MLALMGSGEYLTAVEAIDRELMNRLAEPARVVCLPTAAGTEGHERIHYWGQAGVDHFTRLGAQVEAVYVTDRATAKDPAYAEIIAQANFVYLSGGKPDYLYKTLAGTAVWEAILAVRAKGGVVAGCSAGAMIMGETFFGFPGWQAGFGFLPGVTIVPHFEEIPEMMMKTIRLITQKAITIVGIEGNTILLAANGRYEVLGSGGVTAWNKEGKTRYTEGVLATAVLPTLA